MGNAGWLLLQVDFISKALPGVSEKFEALPGVFGENLRPFRGALRMITGPLPGKLELQGLKAII